MIILKTTILLWKTI